MEARLFQPKNLTDAKRQCILKCTLEAQDKYKLQQVFHQMRRSSLKPVPHFDS